jgi:hypothetical protein
LKLADLYELFERVSRIEDALQQKAGPGTGWDYTFPDGSTTKYQITNVRTSAELKDHFANLALWTWSIKDYFKALAKQHGTDPQDIEEFVNGDPSLPICADLANFLKHGQLKKSRSGRWPTVGEPTYKIDVNPTSVKSILFGAGGLVRIDVADPQQVEISFKVRSSKGEILGDGLEYLRDGIASWETLRERFESAA